MPAHVASFDAGGCARRLRESWTGVLRR